MDYRIELSQDELKLLQKAVLNYLFYDAEGDRYIMYSGLYDKLVVVEKGGSE